MDTMLEEEILQSIHGTLRMHNCRLSGEEIERADREILPFLKEFVVPNVKEPKVKVARSTIPIPNNILFETALRYYAIVQGTVPLLNHLLEKKFPFGRYDRSIPFYLFDGILVSQFTEEEYFSLLKRDHGCLRRFMDSLLGATKEEKEKFTGDFAYVVKRDPTLLKVGIGNEEEEDSFNLLTRHNFELYDKDFFLQMNHHQRIVLNSLIGRVEEEDAKKLVQLFQKYPDFHPNLPFQAEFLRHFTIDELGNMKSKDEEMFLVAMRKNCVERIIELLILNPDFYCPEGVIREEILRSLDNETILGLTVEGLQELANLPIPEMKNVTVFPIRKINRVLFHDKMRKLYAKTKEKIVHK